MDLCKWIKKFFEKFLKNQFHICESCGQTIPRNELCEDCAVERRFVL